MPAAAQDPLIGKTLEKVCILSKLGSGGMGAVYLAEHQTLGKKVAVKILPDHLSKDPEYVARFRREAETCARLEHPNIVQVSDVGNDGGRFFIVMQYVEGESLQSIIEQLGNIEPRDAARVALGVVNGLHHAHGSGIVHRDIKPDNILITKANQPKITDFGLAIETEATQKLTADGTVVGTPYFISPEQAKGRKAEPRSDIYSLGVTLYYMVTGRVPFRGQTALAVLNKHIHETPISPSNLNPKIPAPLNDIILKMLAKRPEDRYFNAEAVRRDLEAFLDNRPVNITVRKTTAVEPAASGSGKGLMIGIAAAIAVLAVIAIAVGTSGNGPKPPVTNGGKSGPVDPPPESEALKEERRRLEALVRESQEHFDDHGSYPRVLRKFEDFASAHRDTPLKAAVDEALSTYLGRINDLGERAYLDIEGRLKGDLFSQLKALKGFPRGLWKYTERGRWVEKRIPEVEGQIRTFVAEELRDVERLIERKEFEEARAKLRSIADHADDRDRVLKLSGKIDELEPLELAAAAVTLKGALEMLEGRIGDALLRGQPSAAWRLAHEFVSTRAPAGVEGRVARLPGLDYPALAKLDIEKAPEAELLVAIGTLDKVLADAKNDPAGGLAAILSDLAQSEWLLRRAVRGMQRVSGGTFVLDGARGTLSAGDTPSFTPEGGGPRPIVLRQLAAADVVALAAAADFGANAPTAEAFQKSKALCAAAGAAYLRSRAPDAKNAARRWFVQASALGAVVPPWRIDDLERDAQIEIERLTREHLTPALEFAKHKKWVEAAKALDDVEARTKSLDVFMTLGPLVRSHRVRLLLSEGAAQLEGRAYARVKEIVALLRRKYDGEFDGAVVDALGWSALLGTGQWNGGYFPDSTSLLTVDERWGWDGKAEKVLPPAKIEDGTMRLDRGRRIMMNPAKTDGTNGMTAKIRLNDQRQSWSFGFYFDVTDKDQQGKWICVSSNGQIQYLTWNNGQAPTVASRKALPLQIQVGKWVELSWVADKDTGELVFYLERQPVFSVQTVLEAKNAIGLQADGDVSFKELKLRKGK